MLAIASRTYSNEGSGQDRTLVIQDPNRTILAVADGAGGVSGGAEAADLALRLIGLEAHTLISEEACKELLEEIDHAISADEVAGETTCVLLVMTPEGLFGASAGDSGAWIITPESTDILTQYQPRKPFFGTAAVVPLGFCRPAWTGTLLAATDGLLKYTSQEAIVETVVKSGFDELPEALLKLVRYRSGTLPDDVGFIVCRSLD